MRNFNALILFAAKKRVASILFAAFISATAFAAPVPGTVVGGPVVPTDSADTFATHLALYGKGGLRTVADLTERNAIPAARAEEGMLVYVVADGVTYRLKPGATAPFDNSEWEVALGAGPGDLWTDGGSYLYPTSNETIRVGSGTTSLPSIAGVSAGIENTGINIVGGDILTFITDGTIRQQIGGGGKQLFQAANLVAATGDEAAYDFSYTVNKATSGNDFGIRLTMTDTASPGTSRLYSGYVGSDLKFEVTNIGRLQLINTDSTGGAFPAFFVYNDSTSSSGVYSSFFLRAGNTSGTNVALQALSDRGAGNVLLRTLAAHPIHFRFNDPSGAQPNFLSIASGEVVVNEDGSSGVAFRAEGDTLPNLLYTNPVSDRVGINTASPTALLTINHAVASNSTLIWQANGTNVLQAGLDTSTDVSIYNLANGYLRFGANNAERLKMTNSLVVFNENAADVDFRVETMTNASAFVIDSGLDTITATSPTSVNVVRNVAADIQALGVTLTNTTGSPTSAAAINVTSAIDTIAAGDNSKISALNVVSSGLQGTGSALRVSGLSAMLTIIDATDGDIPLRTFAKNTSSNRFTEDIATFYGTKDGFYIHTNGADQASAVAYTGITDNRSSSIFYFEQNESYLSSTFPKVGQIVHNGNRSIGIDMVSAGGSVTPTSNYLTGINMTYTGATPVGVYFRGGGTGAAGSGGFGAIYTGTSLGSGSGQLFMGTLTEVNGGIAVVDAPAAHWIAVGNANNTPTGGIVIELNSGIHSGSKGLLITNEAGNSNTLVDLSADAGVSIAATAAGTGGILDASSSGSGDLIDLSLTGSATARLLHLDSTGTSGNPGNALRVDHKAGSTSYAVDVRSNDEQATMFVWNQTGPAIVGAADSSGSSPSLSGFNIGGWFTSDGTSVTTEAAVYALGSNAAPAYYGENTHNDAAGVTAYFRGHNTNDDTVIVRKSGGNSLRGTSDGSNTLWKITADGQATLQNVTLGGTLTSTASGSLGWSVVSSADQACNTTCTDACVFGQNTADMSIVNCAAATADVCVCAGS